LNFHRSCLHAEVRFACLREAASAKAGQAAVGDASLCGISLLILNRLLSPLGLEEVRSLFPGDDPTILNHSGLIK
jgi:hypothetical protein